MPAASQNRQPTSSGVLCYQGDSNFNIPPADAARELAPVSVAAIRA
ncbi:hypothetical protein [Microcoleus sp. herbarium12]